MGSFAEIARIERAFTLLRLYQLTGADQMLADAHAVLARLSEPAEGLPLLVAELSAPECFMLPPFQIPLTAPA